MSSERAAACRGAKRNPGAAGMRADVRVRADSNYGGVGERLESEPSSSNKSTERFGGHRRRCAASTRTSSEPATSCSCPARAHAAPTLDRSRFPTQYRIRLSARRPPQSEPVNHLKARAAVIFNTSNTPAEREGSAFVRSLSPCRLSTQIKIEGAKGGLPTS